MALSYISKKKPDLIITDVAMPVMNGLDMIDEIRRINPEARFIIMSAFEQPRKFMQERHVDSDDFLAKPVDRNKLQLIITKVSDIIQLEKQIKAEREKNQYQQQLLIHKSKLESLGKLAAGIAHEINQPLGGIAMSIENMHYKLKQDSIDKQYFNEKIDTISNNIERINKIIEHIRIFSRAQGTDTAEIFSVNEAIFNALSLTQTQLKNHGIQVRTDISNSKLMALGNKYKLEQVLINLINNARAALKEKKNSENFAPSVWIRSSIQNEKITIEVEDNGIGIEEKTQQMIFDPFFTTKSEGEGTGLGLSISYGIIKEMQGEIEVFSEFGKMTCMKITLPKQN
jgi:C4-dicarboxylate-specific signal transduction histidine kinase